MIFGPAGFAANRVRLDRPARGYRSWPCAAKRTPSLWLIARHEVVTARRGRPRAGQLLSCLTAVASGRCDGEPFRVHHVAWPRMVVVQRRARTVPATCPCRTGVAAARAEEAETPPGPMWSPTNWSTPYLRGMLDLGTGTLAVVGRPRPRRPSRRCAPGIHALRPCPPRHRAG